MYLKFKPLKQSGFFKRVLKLVGMLNRSTTEIQIPSFGLAKCELRNEILGTNTIVLLPHCPVLEFNTILINPVTLNSPSVLNMSSLMKTKNQEDTSLCFTNIFQACDR